MSRVPLRAVLALATACMSPHPTNATPDGAIPDAPVDSTSCGASDAAAGDVVMHVVPPSCTESDVVSWPEPHVAAIDPTAAHSGKLLLFLPGTGLLPSDYELVLATAARAGYLAIGLRYANDKDVDKISDSNDPGCTEQARLEILDGSDRGSDVTVSPADSVIGRTVALLGWLDAAYPDEGWGAFVSGGQPIWSSIAVAGHSLGGGEAALIAIEHAVPRVAMFSAPNDHACGDNTVPAPWEVASTATPPSAWFGLGHLWDTSDEPRELLAWSALGMDPFGMPAASVNVEKVTSPYEHAHELKTDALPATCTAESSCPINDAHRSTAVDANTPLDGAAPHLLLAWQYMLGP